MATSVAQALLKPFVWGAGGAALTPEELARRREEEAQAMAKGVDFSPVGHWTQGLARVANAAAGSFRRGILDTQQGENDTYNKSIIESLFGGSSTADTTPAVPMSSASGEIAATAPSSVDISGDRQAFVDALLPAAIEESKRTGIDPRIIVAQAAQETGWGKSAPGNNFFGIKSHGQSGGQSLATHEYVNGKRVNVKDSFRTFGSPEESVRGYGDFILANPRYEGLRNAQGLDAQLEALGASGYATDPNYSNSVGSIARGIRLPQEVAASTPEAAIEAVSPIAGTSLSDEVAEFRQTPEFMERYPGGYVEQPPQDQGGVPSALVGGTPATGGDAVTVPAANAGQPVGVAEALTAGGQNASSINLAILKALSDPRANAQTRAVAEILMKQQLARQQAEQEMRLKQSDPAYLLGLEKSRLEVENLRSPRLTPGDQLAREKFDWERENAGQTNDIKNYQFYADSEKAAGREPLGPLEWEVAQKKAGAASTNVTVGEGNKFYEALDKKNAETFSALSEEGMRGRSKLAQIDRLDQLLSGAPVGGGAALKLIAGEYGIKTEGLSGLQAAQALINELVPQQRQPGSGPMSDADLALFKQSLPRIINQPEGNRMIIQTMRGITQYQVKMGEIADAVANREMTAQEGRDAIRTLENPLDDYTKAVRQMENDEQDNGAPMSGAVVDGYRFKGGDPADPDNWEQQ